MSRKVRILLVEDNPADAELMIRLIRKEVPDPEVVIVESKDDYVQNLNQDHPDIIISDYTLPQFSGMEALLFRNNLKVYIPFILVTGSRREEVAVECMKSGADDYLMKQNLSRLGHAVIAALDKASTLRSKQLAENEVIRSRKEFQNYFDLSSVGLSVTSADKSWVQVNQKLCEMLGYSKEELTGRKWTEISHDDELDENNRLFRMAVEGEIDKYEIDKKFIRKDRSTVYVNLSVVCQRNEDGSVHHFLSSYVDITERKKYEDELILEKERALESDRLKTAFLHNISHEIRTPLNSIVGFSSLLNDDENLPRNLRNYTGIIQKSSDHLLSIVNDIIDISNIEAGILKTTLSELSISGLLSELFDQYKIRAQEKGLQLFISSRPDKSYDKVTNDITRLRQVLSNLINNALKFTSSGSVSFGCRNDMNYLQFSVKDTGIGIPVELHDRIFERFFQAEMPPSVFNYGIGLGLSISKSFVEHMGGSMWVESEPDKGSEFRFTLPYIPAKSENKKSERTIVENNGKGFHLLVAEDDEANYKLISHLLKGRNLHIHHASNGREAIDIFEHEKRIDLVIMDIKMPLINGYLAARTIKDKAPDIPIVALTAYAFPSDNVRAMESGFSDYLTKPFRRDQLFGIIERYLK